MARSSAVDHFNFEAAVTFFALNLAVVFILLAAITRHGAIGWLVLDRDFGRCLPPWNLPNHTCETFKSETAFLPFTTWLASSIECPKASIDSTLIGFGAEFVCSPIHGSRNGRRVVDGSILPEVELSTNGRKIWTERLVARFGIHRRRIVVGSLFVGMTK